MRGSAGVRFVNLLFAGLHCESIGDSKLLFLKFPPFVRSGSILFGTSPGEREGVLLLLSADWLHASGGGDDLIPSTRK